MSRPVAATRGVQLSPVEINCGLAVPAKIYCFAMRGFTVRILGETLKPLGY